MKRTACVLGPYVVPQLLGEKRAGQKKVSGIALTLYLSDLWFRELRAKIRRRFPKASRREIENRIYRYICRMEKIKQQTRVIVKRSCNGRFLAVVVREKSRGDK